MTNEQEKSNNRLYIGVAIIALVICAVYLLRSCGNIHDNGAGIDDVRSGIAESTESNRELQEQLSDAKKTTGSIEASIDRSEGAINDAEKTTGSIEHNLETAADAVTKCQRIVDGIKQRNAERTPQP